LHRAAKCLEHKNSNRKNNGCTSCFHADFSFAEFSFYEDEF
jgi:hypothetical protein